ncbi:hypothetical protein [Elioraea tepidiphila]|uniref:hypothetical protein n=1 Tax=Elioraea tepidiphila TaxID=457934 RepID=UPI00037F313F|nr:hypothetical protein [Elioraea tepidiphila]
MPISVMIRTSWLPPDVAAVSTGCAGMSGFLGSEAVTLIAPDLRVNVAIEGAGMLAPLALEPGGDRCARHDIVLCGRGMA